MLLQVSLLHVEAMNILNRDYFHLNDLNLSLLWRMLVTSTHHNIGIHNDKLSSMGSSMVACRYLFFRLAAHAAASD